MIYFGNFKDYVSAKKRLINISLITCLMLVSLTACNPIGYKIPSTATSIPLATATSMADTQPIPISTTNLETTSVQEEFDQPTILAEEVTMAFDSTASPTNLPTSQPTITPTPLPESPHPTEPLAPLPDLLLAYAEKIMTDDTSYSQLWLVDTQTNEKHVIYTTPLGSEIGPLMSWHPYDEKILYFVQYFSVEAEAKDWQLWRFDVTTMTAEAVSELFSEGFGLLIDWSATGDWLHLTAGKWSGSELQVDEIVINIQSGAVIHLGVDTSSDYFAWNPNQDEQYAVYRVSTRNADRDIEHISIFDLPKQSIAQRIALQLSTKHMEQIRNGFAPNIILGWQPQGTDLLVEAEGELYEYDTASEQWFALNVDSPTGIDNLIWSPGGSWVLLRRGSEILYSLPKDNLSHQPKRIVEDSHRILGWFDQLDWPIISMNDKIWLIDPGLTVSNIELYDLTTIGLDTSHSQQLAVLVVN